MDIIGVFNFLSAVLGSVGFWVVYFVVGSIVGTITLKTIAKDTFKYVTTGILSDVGEEEGYIILAITHYLLWPCVVLACAIFLVIWLAYKCLVLLLWPLFQEWILVINKVIPTIKFKKGEEKTKEVYEENDNGELVLVSEKLRRQPYDE